MRRRSRLLLVELCIVSAAEQQQSLPVVTAGVSLPSTRRIMESTCFCGAWSHLFRVRTLIIECREQANIFLNSARMSSKSTSLRLTITLMRVLSSVPAPWNTHTHIMLLELQLVPCSFYEPCIQIIRLLTDNYKPNIQSSHMTPHFLHPGFLPPFPQAETASHFKNSDGWILLDSRV